MKFLICGPPQSETVETPNNLDVLLEIGQI
jgi:hypothetical protein